MHWVVGVVVMYFTAHTPHRNPMPALNAGCVIRRLSEEGNVPPRLDNWVRCLALSGKKSVSYTHLTLPTKA